MKTPVAVTLIIMGALLVMTPVLSDYAYQRNLVELMTQSNVTNVMLAGKMEELYRFGCWLTGSVMVVVAVFASLMQRAPEPQAPGVRTPVA